MLSFISRRQYTNSIGGGELVLVDPSRGPPASWDSRDRNYANQRREVQGEKRLGAGAEGQAPQATNMLAHEKCCGNRGQLPSSDWKIGNVFPEWVRE